MRHCSLLKMDHQICDMLTQLSTVTAYDFLANGIYQEAALRWVGYLENTRLAVKVPQNLIVVTF